MLFKRNLVKNLIRNEPVSAKIHTFDHHIWNVIRGTTKDRKTDFICIAFDNGLDVYMNGDTALVLRKLLDDACDDMCKIIENCDGNSQDLPEDLQCYSP